MSMTSILVPTEQREGMPSALQTALLLARRFDSYIEGFALRARINELVIVDRAGSLPLDSFGGATRHILATATLPVRMAH